jgi:hypothetical protein
MSWIFSLLTGIPGFLNGLLAYLQKRQDTLVVQNTNARDIGVEVVRAETLRLQAAASVMQVAMGHWVFWFAWCIGVLPVMGYYACIFFVSTFPMYGWTVMKAPPDALEFGHTVTAWMFGISGTSSVVAGIAHAWARRT